MTVSEPDSDNPAPLPPADADGERIAAFVTRARALPVDLAPAGAAVLLRYLDAMLRENERVNLTAIRDPAHAAVLHALDSVAVGLALPQPPRAALDLGTGNGFPGVAVHALWPRCRLVLCDRTQKKVAAVARCLAAAGIEGVEAAAVDVAQAPALRAPWVGAFDLVTVRAVGSPEAVAPLARPLLAPRGRLVLWLDADAATPALRGFTAEARVGYELPEPAARARRLAVYLRSTS